MPKPRRAICPICKTERQVNRRGEIMYHTQNGLFCLGTYSKVADRIHYQKPKPEPEPTNPNPTERIAELRALIAQGKLEPEAAARARTWTIPRLRAQI